MSTVPTVAELSVFPSYLLELKLRRRHHEARYTFRELSYFSFATKTVQIRPNVGSQVWFGVFGTDVFEFLAYMRKVFSSCGLSLFSLIFCLTLLALLDNRRIVTL